MVDFAKARNVHKGHENAFTPAESGAVAAEEASTAVAVVESQAASLGAALHVNRTFTSSAMRSGEESGTSRWLSWFTGNNEMFAANGTTPLEAAKGFFIDQPDEEEMFPDDYALMDAMDLLCQQGKAREVKVAHPVKGEKPRKVASWQIYDVSLFVVCKGVPTKREMDSDGSDRWGVAYGWEPGKGGRSQVRFLCFIKELMDAGYNGIFQASFSSYLTPKIISVLNAQQYVLSFVNELRSRMGDTDPLPYYAYALPVKCSVKTLTAKSSETGDSKELYYPISGIPRLSERDPESAKTYLAAMGMTDEQQYIVEYNGRVDQAVTWSIKESARILAGKDGEDNGATSEGSKEKASVELEDHPF